MNYPKPKISITRLEKYAAEITKTANLLKLLQDSARAIANAPTISYEHINRISNLLKFPCKPNSKAPLINDNLNPNNWSRKRPKGNYGIPCGKDNNLLIVDIDTKNNQKGYEEWCKYTDKFKEPQTYKANSANGGLHYYFNWDSPTYTDDMRYKIQNYLYKQTKIRTDIDIISQSKDGAKSGGYIIGPGSKFEGKAYTVAKDLPIVDMPESVIDWLLEPVPIIEKTCNNQQKTNYNQRNK